ncbi:uncharacterized protein LOC111714379 isoform X2 [Eurytemora carolleeae]|uniref:uncharacterized protein LOC111714379 isoform X2 n=1 Tax=Eurytemora carolleeae TaxID=1294199 RepID=UPI000C765815|nr:uncharacterized protein LOC111714379 isoform X2 [Eurytemora carolleeae]|eukprot:XP_023345243.1 uncharacterized protein LOC111714379 isoform X2 [Eurytemora affinis]
MADLKGVSVTDLNATLEDPEVLDAFREFLRIKLDNNKSTNIDLKKKFEQWLDYVIICNKIFSLAEEDIEDCINLMVEVGERFIAKPPGGYNIALAGQLNRKALEQHCKELGDKTTLDPDTGLLRPGYLAIYLVLDLVIKLFILF